MYEGKVIELYLNRRLTIFVCKSNTDHTVSNVTQFIRKTKFVRDGNDKIFIRWS